LGWEALGISTKEFGCHGNPANENLRNAKKATCRSWIWIYFYKWRNATEGMRVDDQLLLASFVNQVRELLEGKGDTLGLEWLDQLECECF
jgi:hypothetical protein